MLNVFAAEAVVLVPPRKITSKEDETKFFAFMSLGIAPFDAKRDWLRKMISEGRKTGYVFANAITISGETTNYALKALKRGDMISLSGSLSMMNAKKIDSDRFNYTLEQKIGIRIERFEILCRDFLKSDKRNIPQTPTMIGLPRQVARQQYPIQSPKESNRMPDNSGSYQKDNGILDDTEFNFED